MFDTTNFIINRNDFNINPLDTLEYLENVSEHYNEKKGFSASGKIGDYTVSIYENGIYLRGSLAKNLYLSNVQTLTREDAEKSIQKLSDGLHIDIKKGKVTRLDFSTVIQTSRPPADYYTYLVSKPYYERVLSTNNTLYFNTQKTQLVFYDKIKDCKAKKIPIPQNYIGSNLMRYELRYLREIARQLKVDTITGATLTDPQFYYKLVQKWGDEFKKIKKTNDNMMVKDNIKTPGDGINAYCAILILQNGIDNIDKYINDLKAKGTYSDPGYYWRVKNGLKKLITDYNMKNENVINELEIAIDNIVKNAM
ncbi:MAG TPA: hypothetical protein PLH70_01785 [Bacteroidales bacterium]|nr:hypothetical protein [Bacteroidales bacterium]HOH22161.1 hypothetical protein [Bacteroidales bacterium]HPZ02586.1 hypothetical protein [Bacteroidales bacterium]HQB74515.1 hypothetical protein [Bacteroidales bacterium]